MPDWPGEGDNEGLPIKGGRPRGGAPGGSTPGPGGGFGGGFGGGGFFGAGQGAPSGEFFGINTIWPRRKVVTGPNGPILMSYSPMTQRDTVPAMLTPGEGVLNNGAMAEPGMEGFLNAANQRGAQRMAMGGMAGMEGGAPMDEGMMGGGPPDDRREIIMKLLRLLLDDGPQQFAYGGMVTPQRRGYGAPMPVAPTMPQSPGGAVSAPGTAQSSMADILGNSGMFGSKKRLWQAPGGGLGAGEPPVTSSNDPNVLGSGDPMMQNLRRLLELFQQGGAFGPEGNPALLESLRGEALGNADALRRRAGTLADVSGLDPGQRGSYAMQTDLNTQGDVANILSGAKRGQLENQQRFGQEMFGNLTNFDFQRLLAQLAADYQKQLKRIH